MKKVFGSLSLCHLIDCQRNGGEVNLLLSQANHMPVIIYL